MKIAFLELHDWEEKYLRGKIDPVHEVAVFREALADKQLVSIANAEIISPFIYSKLTAKRLAELAKLKMVCLPNTVASN